MQGKLLIELIPASCSYSNVRSTVKPKDWDKIRFIIYEQANHICEICAETGKEQGYRHNVECHEIWSYDDKHMIQSLIGMQSLCVRCHMAKHIGRASAIGKQGEIFAHMERVNGWSHYQVVSHMAESYALQKSRSKYIYSLDLSLLNEEPYEIGLDLNAKRKFTKATYKKKRRKRTKK